MGFAWCYDEIRDNGGCASPYQNNTNCVEAPVTNPISINIYAPQGSGEACVCVLQSTNMPTGQMRGRARGQCGVQEP